MGRFKTCYTELDGYDLCATNSKKHLTEISTICPRVRLPFRPEILSSKFVECFWENI